MSCQIQRKYSLSIYSLDTKKFNKAVLSPLAGTAIPLALHVSPKPRR